MSQIPLLSSASTTDVYEHKRCHRHFVGNTKDCKDKLMFLGLDTKTMQVVSTPTLLQRVTRSTLTIVLNPSHLITTIVQVMYD